MKHIFFILLLFFGFNAKTQTLTDTVDVVLLACDTSQSFYIDHEYVGSDTINGYYAAHYKRDTIWTENREIGVFWMLGKEVLEQKLNPMHLKDSGISPHLRNYQWIHKTYLDDQGKPLPKHIIVWQSVRRKN